MSNHSSRHPRRSLLVLAVTALCSALILSSCSSSQSKPQPEPTPEPTATPIPEISLAGQTWQCNIRKLSLEGNTDLTARDFVLLRDTLECFPCLEELNLSETNLTDEQRKSICLANPSVAVEFDTVIFDIPVSTFSETLDLSRIHIENSAEVEAILPYFPKLKTVDMSLCGLSDAEMDSLNRAHEDIDFIWMVHVRRFGIRTDATYFCQWNSPYAFSADLDRDNYSLDALKYCTQIEALDLGKLTCKYTTIDSLAYLTNLKYLVLSKGYGSDISSLGNMKELLWLEMFASKATDLSPLLNCKKLESLNIGSCYYLDKQETMDILKQMTQLKLLLITVDQFTYAQYLELSEALPNTHIIFTENVVDKDWRGAKGYFDMRDALHMYYMDDGGNSVPVNPYTGEPNKYPETNPFR